MQPVRVSISLFALYTMAVLVALQYNQRTPLPLVPAAEVRNPRSTTSLGVCSSKRTGLSSLLGSSTLKKSRKQQGKSAPSAQWGFSHLLDLRLVQD